MIRHIVLNGEDKNTHCETLEELIADLALTHSRIAVEINDSLITKSKHATTLLRNHDRIEIVHAVGGG